LANAGIIAIKNIWAKNGYAISALVASWILFVENNIDI